jgi:predicted dehydrogenase
LRMAGVAGVGVGFPNLVPWSVFGANAPSNRITLGCIGTGGMGTSNLKAFVNRPDAKVLAVCDVDLGHREEARTLAGLTAPASYNDFREVLARPDIDAVVVCTPDHWHVPISIAAVRAGKDVYCEKPLTLTVAEGRTLVNAVRQYGRVLQTGSQQRSSYYFRFACELVRNGRIGKLHTMNTGISNNSRPNPLHWKPMPAPEGFDYEMWLGPAPWAPYTEKRCHYRFRFILDYSGGQMTNWGAHNFDIAQWGNNADDTGPVAVQGQGQFPKEGLFTTAEHVALEYTYANGVKLLINKGGHTFEGTEGWVHVSREHIDAEPKSLLKSIIRPEETHLYYSEDHHGDFLNCVRGRTRPIADVEIGHRSATVCHIGNIAMLLGRKLQWDPVKEQFVNDDEANRYLSRPMRSPWHL